MPHKNSHSPEARASMARRNKRYYEKNRETILEYKNKRGHEYYLKNKDRWKKYLVGSSMKRRCRMFGITEEWYLEAQKTQGNKCAICGVDANTLKKTLCVDHNHTTGAVRELLCDDCNVALGRIRESVITARSMAKYILKHSPI
jgi:hypothetical protein